MVIYSWNKGLIYGLLLLLLPGMAAAQQVVIIKSSNNNYFSQTIATLINHADDKARFKVIEAQELAEKAASYPRDSLFITFGQKALNALNQLQDAPYSLNAYVTMEQYQKLRNGNQVAVLLDQPLNRYLAFCKLVLDVEQIGILGEQPLELDARQRQLMRKLAIDLNQYQLDTENKLLPVLRKLMRQNDVLLMLPRQSIFNRDSLKGVLLTSYRNRKPAISYSPAHVKSGALASIYSSPVDIGRHLAILVNLHLKNRRTTANSVQYARFYSISTNPKVARALGINLPLESELRSRLDRLEP